MFKLFSILDAAKEVSFLTNKFDFMSLKVDIAFFFLFLNLLKCALQNSSLKAHSKARNIFVEFFGNPGSMVT